MSERRNILLTCVPHSGSTVITRMIHLIAGHFHGPEDDHDYWRRAECRWTKIPSTKLMMEWEQKVPQSDDDLQFRVADFAIRTDQWEPQPWIIKDTSFWASMNYLGPALSALPCRPMLLLVTRDPERIRSSYHRRGQLHGLDQHNPPLTIQAMEEAARLGYEAYPGDKATLAFESVLAIKEGRRDPAEVFSFLGDGLTAADYNRGMEIFTVRRATGKHPKESGW